MRLMLKTFHCFAGIFSNNVGRNVSEMSTSSASCEFNCCLLIALVTAHDGYKFGIMSSIGSGTLGNNWFIAQNRININFTSCKVIAKYQMNSVKR